MKYGKLKSIAKSKETEDLEFPMLMATKSYPVFIILATALDNDLMRGFVVNTGDSIDFNLGDYADDWNLDSFNPYNGKVILANHN